MKRLVALTTLVVSVLLCHTAVAQEQTWLRDRQYREGAGIRVGDFELHPGIGADFGYDSNYYHRSENENPIGALRLRVSPHFGVSTLGPQRRDDGDQPSVNFRAEIGATYNEFIPVSGDDVNGEYDTLRDQRSIPFFGRVNLDILPGRTWSGNVRAGIAYETRPTEQPFPDENFNRFMPEAGAELIWTPGSGLLDWRLGYAFTGTFFQSSAFEGLNSFRNDIITRGRWRFLPRTALMYDATLGFITYPNAASGSANKADSHPLRVHIGVNGLITQSFGILALVGWGSSFYSDPDPEVQDFDSVIGQVELKWYLTPTRATDPAKVSSVLSSISVGFIRDFEDAYIGSYLEKDQGYIRFNYLFGGQFLLVVEARAGAVRFPPQITPSYGPDADDGWTDARVDGTLFREWRAKDWLAINLEYNYIGYFSGTTLQFFDATGAAAGQDELAYQDHRVFLGIRVFW